MLQTPWEKGDTQLSHQVSLQSAKEIVECNPSAGHDILFVTNNNSMPEHYTNGY